MVHVFGIKVILVFMVWCFVLSDETLTKSDRERTKKKKLNAAGTKEHQNVASSSSTTNSHRKTLGGGGGADVAAALFVYEDVLKNFDRVDYGEKKKFPNPVLAYVTPWNNHGYDIAKHLAHKFTHVSPVWLQINKHSDGCSIAGSHDVDRGWITDVRKNNSAIKIVPRFLFDKWNSIDLQKLLYSEDEQNRCAGVIIDYILRNKFDGAVVEAWIQIQAAFRGRASLELSQFLINLAEHFQSVDKEFILVVPPLRPGSEIQMFTHEDIASLVPYVDYFSVMTYDFPNEKAGPVAPLFWIRECLESLSSTSEDVETRQKLMMGLNFYGYDYQTSNGNVEAIVGPKYTKLLEKYKPVFQYNKQGVEHYFQYPDHTVYYPSLNSIEARLNLAQELGVGVAIWETGQGLDYFYNLM